MNRTQTATGKRNALPMMCVTTEKVVLRNRLENIAKARPDLCILMSYQANGTAEYMIPQRWIGGSSGGNGNSGSSADPQEVERLIAALSKEQRKRLLKLMKLIRAELAGTATKADISRHILSLPRKDIKPFTYIILNAKSTF